MQIRNRFNYTSFFLRLAIGIPYLWFAADRLGFLGPPGSPHVGWGDWPHFLQYAAQVMSFLPARVISIFCNTCNDWRIQFWIIAGDWIVHPSGSHRQWPAQFFIRLFNGHFIWYRISTRIFCFYRQRREFPAGSDPRLQMEY